MTAQIRPNRMEVNDRFPMLGFAIRSDSPGVDAEVVLASDIALFRPENRAQRTAANFYSSREHGMLAMPRGEGIFTVPSDVLARLIGNDRVFFGLATGKAGNGGLTVDALPRDGSPYVSLRGFTGRTLRRSYGSGRANTPPVLEWSGDSARPGAEPVTPTPVGTHAPAANSGPAIAPPANGAGPVPYDDGFGPIPAIPAASAPISAEPVSSAMIIGPDDVQQAQRYAPEWRDLYNFRASAAVNAAMVARGFSVQTISDAAGALNLDKYEVNCSRLPTGFTAAQIVELMRKSINNFIDTDNTEFLPYAPSDAALIASANPVPAVWKLDIIGPDNAAVVIAESTSRYFRVCTLETPDTGSHPVSGTREWGYRGNDGAFVFYTRAADRATYGVAETVVWTGANHLWRSLQTKLTDWINANGGAATIGGVVSERFHPEVVRILYGAQAQGLSADDTSAAAGKAIVMPALPGDARGRATRIGGEFAARIGEALDLGLAESNLAPLLDKLDPPAAAVPLAPVGAMSTSQKKLGLQMSSGLSVQSAFNWIKDKVQQVANVVGDDVSPPRTFALGENSGAFITAWRAYFGVTGLLIPTNAFLAAIPSAASHLQTTLSIGPALDTPFFGAGIGVVFAPDGQVALFGSLAADLDLDGFSEFIDSLKLALQAKLKLGYNSGGISGFQSLAKVAGVSIGEELVGGAEVWLNGEGQLLGGAVSIGVGFALQLAAEQAAQPAATEEDAARTGPGAVNLAPPPEPVARGMDAGAVATIAGVVLQQVISNSGDVSWTTDQFRGIKHPNDTAPANPGPFQDATPISLNWPVLSDSYIDDISAFFRIDWQHNGKSIGNVRITNTGTNDAIGWSLAVRGTIMDDNRVHPPHDCAGLRITLHYHFTHVVGSDQIAMCDIEIFGDGTHTKNCRWIQSSLFAAEQARSMVAA